MVALFKLCMYTASRCASSRVLQRVTSATNASNNSRRRTSGIVQSTGVGYPPLHEANQALNRLASEHAFLVAGLLRREALALKQEIYDRQFPRADVSEAELRLQGRMGG